MKHRALLSLLLVFVLLFFTGCASMTTGGRHTDYYDAEKAIAQGASSEREAFIASLEKLWKDSMDAKMVEIKFRKGSDKPDVIVHSGVMVQPMLLMYAMNSPAMNGAALAAALSAVATPKPTATEILSKGVANVLPLGLSVFGMWGVAHDGFRTAQSLGEAGLVAAGDRTYNNSNNSARDGSTVESGSATSYKDMSRHSVRDEGVVNSGMGVTGTSSGVGEAALLPAQTGTVLADGTVLPHFGNSAGSQAEKALFIEAHGGL